MLSRRTFLAGAAAIGVSAPALAQDATAKTSGQAGAQAPASPGTPPPATTQADTPPSTDADIIVTGSRISRRDYQSSSPISTVTSSTIASGVIASACASPCQPPFAS